MNFYEQAPRGEALNLIGFQPFGRRSFAGKKVVERSGVAGHPGEKNSPDPGSARHESSLSKRYPPTFLSVPGGPNILASRSVGDFGATIISCPPSGASAAAAQRCAAPLPVGETRGSRGKGGGQGITRPAQD